VGGAIIAAPSGRHLPGRIPTCREVTAREVRFARL